MPGRALTLIGVTAVFTGLMTTGPASADVTALMGRVRAGFTTFEGGPTNTLTEFGPEVILNAPPGSLGPFTDSWTISGVPASGTQVLRSGGGNLGTHAGFVAGSTTVTNLSIPGRQFSGGPDVSATQIEASCRSNGDGSSGTMTMTGGALFGVPVPSGPVEPNTQFLKVVPNLAGGFEVVSGVLNEQTITNEAGVTSIEMTAVRIRLEQNIGPRTGVGVGRLRCQASGPDVNPPPTTTSSTTTSISTTTSSTTTSSTTTSSTTTSSSTTSSSSTSSTTLPPPPPTDRCSSLRSTRDGLNAQIDQAEQGVSPSLLPAQRAALIAQLEQERAAGNAQILAAMAMLHCAPP